MIYRFAVVVAAVSFIAACSNIGTSSLGSSSGQPGVAGLSSNTGGPPVKYFQTPTQFSWPEYIRMGPDGNLWFTEYYANNIARVTPAGTIMEFAEPADSDNEALVTGPDGNIWFTSPGSNQIGRMTTSGAFTMFDIPTSNSSPRGIAVGPDGNLWFAEYYAGKIGRITPSGSVMEFSISINSSPWEIIAGTDGIMYVTDSTSDEIERFDPSTLKFMSPIQLRQADNPWGLTIGQDHNVWFTGRASHKIGVIVNGKVHEFKIPTDGAYPDDLAQGSDGIFYITDSLRNSISRFNPTTGTFEPRIILGTTSIPTSIAVGSDGNIWFTDPSYTSPARIGRLSI
ncbi:MAG TPA: hypothetical protein VEV38_03725 [Candidatus Eremiobacteraceae bacterium]|nr:hypothetical protein [Candidatus Eremiobacteraceae bacterium]